jgi:hypothetical protein
MRVSAFILWAAIITIGVGAATWLVMKHSHETGLNTSSQLQRSSTKPKPKGFQPVPTQFLTESEWRRLHAVREETLKANPTLTAEYQQIQAEMADEQQKWDAAMIQAEVI